MYFWNYFLIGRLVSITKLCNVIRKKGYATYSGMRCSIGEPTKNVIFNSQYIEGYEAIPLNIGQLDNIGAVGMEDATSMV